MTEGLTLADLVLVGGVAFVLGSIPTAYIVARLRGVNIFEVGTRQAGAANVYREVGRTAAYLVGFIDAFKGGLAIVIAMMVGLDGSWLLLPAVAAILGHWNSPMTRFRGGDGVATAVGVMFLISPTGMFIPILVGAIVTLLLSTFLEHPTPWGGLAVFVTFLAVAQLEFTGLSASTAIGMSLIGASIYMHSLMYHRRKGDTFSPGGLENEPDLQDPRTQGP